MAFQSIYTLDFREPGIYKARSEKQIDKFAERVDTSKFLDFKDLNVVATYTNDEQKRLIKNMYKNFYSSEYVHNYCREGPKFEEHDSSHSLVRMEEIKKLFDETKTYKVLPPIPTARRAYKFMSSNDMRTPLTTYQNVHDRVGYFIIKTKQKHSPDQKKEATKKTTDVNVKPENIAQAFDNESIDKSEKKETIKEPKTCGKLQQKYYFVASDEPQQYTFVFDPKKKDVVQLKQ